MNKLLLLAGIAGTALSTAHAGGGYVQIHGGVFSQTEDSLEFAGGELAGGETDPETGFAAGALLGLYIFPYIAAEGEFTLRTNTLESIDTGSVGDAIENDQTTYAFMGNLVFRPELPLFPLKPYIGAGGGWIQPNFDNGDDPDGEFAWQVKAGANVDLLPTPGMLGVEVSYLSTGDFELPSESEVLTGSIGYGGVTGLVTYKIGF